MKFAYINFFMLYAYFLLHFFLAKIEIKKGKRLIQSLEPNQLKFD